MSSALFTIIPPELLEPVEPFQPVGPEESIEAAIDAHKAGRVIGGLAAAALLYHYEATHDDLTGLLNKAELKKDVHKRVESAQNETGSSEFGFFFADLTNIKIANDDLGHERVDKLLRDFAARLNYSLRTKKEETLITQYDLRNSEPDRITHERLSSPKPVDEASRYGGDEFAGVVDLTPLGSELDDKNTPMDRLCVVVERIRNTWQKFIAEQEQAIRELPLDIAIGFQVWEDGMSAEDLINKADKAMYEEKAAQHEKLGSYR